MLYKSRLPFPLTGMQVCNGFFGLFCADSSEHAADVRSRISELRLEHRCFSPFPWVRSCASARRSCFPRWSDRQRRHWYSILVAFILMILFTVNFRIAYFLVSMSLQSVIKVVDFHNSNSIWILISVSRWSPTRLRASVEVFSVPDFRNVGLGAYGVLEAAEITSLLDKHWTHTTHTFFSVWTCVFAP